MPKFSKVSKWIVVIIIVASLLGFADATYLSVLHFKNQVPPCSLIQGCEKVLSSDYSVFAGIPVALAGSVYYFIVLVLSLAYLDHPRELLMRIIVVLSPLAFLGSLVLVYLQLFVLHSICPYCMFSALTSILIFGSVVAAYFKKPDVVSS